MADPIKRKIYEDEEKKYKKVEDIYERYKQ